MQIRDTADCESALPQRGFTLIELLVVLAVVAALACVLVPGLAHTQPDVRAAQCLSNKRQVALACVMYSHDWSDYLVPNAPAGEVRGWCNGQENWGSSAANTNANYYLTNCLARYVANQIRVYKCPCDTIPSNNGDRLRSISMNCMMVGALPISNQSYNAGWREYRKLAEVTRPSPSMAWVFCDENMYTLNDGFLQMGLNSFDFADIPAAYHGGDGNCFTFVDGHAEPRKWLGPWTRTTGIKSCPYAKDVQGAHWPISGLDVDWSWLRDRTSAKQ